MEEEHWRLKYQWDKKYVPTAERLETVPSARNLNSVNQGWVSLGREVLGKKKEDGKLRDERWNWDILISSGCRLC